MSGVRHKPEVLPAHGPQHPASPIADLQLRRIQEPPEDRQASPVALVEQAHGCRRSQVKVRGAEGPLQRVGVRGSEAVVEGPLGGLAEIRPLPNLRRLQQDGAGPGRLSPCDLPKAGEQDILPQASPGLVLVEDSPGPPRDLSVV